MLRKTINLHFEGHTNTLRTQKILPKDLRPQMIGFILKKKEIIKNINYNY